MNARLLTAATLTVAFSAALPAAAADSGLVNLLMPDVKVVAGVNVEQAKTTPFGQYVLQQIQSSQDTVLQKLATLTGFDPTRDVRELLIGTNVTGSAVHAGLLLARGTFDPGKITAVATLAGHSVTETYGGVSIIEDEKQTHGFAFLDATLVVAGDVASVKGAIDRQNAAAVIPAPLVVQINHWSTTEDAWGISTVPLSTLAPAGAVSANGPAIPGLNGQGPFQAIQSAAGGVKFGTVVVVTAQAQADTTENATTIANTLKLLASLAQLQASKDPAVADLAQSLQVTTQGATVNISVSLPEDQLQQVLKPKANVRRVGPAARPR